jgi:hypothetical protein
MARKRNSDRLGAPTPEDTSVAAATTTTDIFSFVTPTEFVELPSKGRFYEEGSPLAGLESIEIRHMTAKEEDLLTSESLLRKGVALDRMLQALLVNQTLDLDDFLIGDKNALIIASRISGFGPEYVTRVTCPACANVNETEFNLESLSLHLVEDLPEEVEETVEGTFKFTLPTTQVELEVRLLTARLEKQLSTAAERKKKMNLPDTRSTDLLKTVIVSINGVTDTSMISRFVDLMPALDSRYMRRVYERIKPDVDLDHEFTCENCSYGGKVVMPLTAEFFWPRN